MFTAERSDQEALRNSFQLCAYDFGEVLPKPKSLLVDNEAPNRAKQAPHRPHGSGCTHGRFRNLK